MKREDLKAIIQEIIEESGHVSPCNNPTKYDFNKQTGQLHDQSGQIAFGGQVFGSKEEAAQFLEDGDHQACVVDELEEISSTGGAAGANAGYLTPNAFAGSSSDIRKKKDIAARSMPGGKVVGENEETILEGRGRYYNLKESDLVKHESKVSYLLQEINRMLKEVNLLVDFSKRLKTEEGISPKWKRSQHHLMEILKQLKGIGNKIRHI